MPRRRRSSRAIRAAHLEGKAKTIHRSRRGLVIRLDHRRGAVRARQATCCDPRPYPLLTTSPTRSSRFRTPYASRATPTRCRARASSGTTGLSFDARGHRPQLPRAPRVHDRRPPRCGSRRLRGRGIRSSPNSPTTGNPRNRRVEIVILRNHVHARERPRPDRSATPIGPGADRAPPSTATRSAVKSPARPCRYREIEEACVQEDSHLIAGALLPILGAGGYFGVHDVPRRRRQGRVAGRRHRRPC